MIYFLIILLVYLLFLLSLRIVVNIKYDKILNIETRGLRDWDKTGQYHRTESTPYLALKALVSEYKFNNDDKMIDYGAGKGRVSLFVHNKIGISITGVEINEFTYKEALANLASYKHINNIKQDKKVRFVKEYAENYKINDENTFFFFNPFSSDIFKKVVDNIIDNANQYDKEVKIILYYPTKKYKDFLKTTPFTINQKIKPKGSISPREMFIIYKYKGVHQS